MTVCDLFQWNPWMDYLSFYDVWNNRIIKKLRGWFDLCQHKLLLVFIRVLYSAGESSWNPHIACALGSFSNSIDWAAIHHPCMFSWVWFRSVPIEWIIMHCKYTSEWWIVSGSYLGEYCAKQHSVSKLNISGLTNARKKENTLFVHPELEYSGRMIQVEIISEKKSLWSEKWVNGKFFSFL